MKEHPIIFSTDMVKAILDGRKTMTRRVIKPQPTLSAFNFAPYLWKGTNFDKMMLESKCPYGQVGDRLWVRETFTDLWCSCIDLGDLIYKATPPNAKFTVSRWRPSIHMPRWASRLDIPIDELGVGLLRETSLADAHREGFNTLEEFIRTFLALNHLSQDADHWNWEIGWLYEEIKILTAGYG